MFFFLSVGFFLLIFVHWVAQLHDRLIPTRLTITISDSVTHHCQTNKQTTKCSLFIIFIAQNVRSHSSKVNAFSTVVCVFSSKKRFLLYFIRAIVFNRKPNCWNNTLNMILWAAECWHSATQSKKRMTLYPLETIVKKWFLLCGLLFGLNFFVSFLFATVNYLIFAYKRYVSSDALLLAVFFLSSHLHCLLAHVSIISFYSRAKKAEIKLRHSSNGRKNFVKWQQKELCMIYLLMNSQCFFSLVL